MVHGAHSRWEDESAFESLLGLLLLSWVGMGMLWEDQSKIAAIAGLSQIAPGSFQEVEKPSVPRPYLEPFSLVPSPTMRHYLGTLRASIF